MIKRSLVAAACLSMFVACGGGAASPPVPPSLAGPSHGGPPVGTMATAHIVISIPAGSTAAAHSGNPRPSYVSPSTQSVTVQVDSAPAVTQNLSPSSPNCASAGANYPLNCTVTVSATAGTHALTFATFDQQNGAGNPLSTNSISVNFIAGQNPAVPVVLAGVPSGVQILPSGNSTTIQINTPILATPGIQWVWGVPQTLNITAIDADGNYIIGPGSPTLSVSVTPTDGAPGITLSSASNGNPNQFTLQSTAAGYATLSVTATPQSALAGSPVVTTFALASVAGATPLLSSPEVSGVFLEYGSGLALNTSNSNLYIYNDNFCQIMQVSPAGAYTVIAGGSCAGNAGGYADGAGGSAQFSNSVSGVAFDSSNGNLYVADAVNCSIRQVTPGGVVTTIAGELPPTVGCAFADGTGGGARFNFHYYGAGITYDPVTDALYVGDTGNCAIRKVTTAGVVTTIAGSVPTNPTCGFANGTGGNAKFGAGGPRGIAYDSLDGNLYVADYSDCAVAQVTTSGVVTWIAGKPGNASSPCMDIDGTGSSARFHFARGIAFDQDNGQLYVTDNSCSVRQVSTSGTVVTIGGVAPGSPIPFGVCGYTMPPVGSGTTLGTTMGLTPAINSLAYDHATGLLYVSDLFGIWQLQL